MYAPDESKPSVDMSGNPICIVAVPLPWFSKLREACLEEREKWTLDETEDTVIWPNLNLSITAEELLKTSRRQILPTDL